MMGFLVNIQAISIVHIAKVNGRFCEAKRTRSVITGQINKA